MPILLVEDEWLIRIMVAEELRENGFDVREAESGDQAALLVAQGDVSYALLVTDIHMPGQLDGIALARLLRERWPDLPIIFMTGRPDVLNRLQPFGPKEVFLPKPFALSELLATAHRLLD